jgi:hypothetical protein
MTSWERYTEDREAGSGQMDQLSSRVVEKLADAPDGGRQYRVRVISAGESLNKRFYPEAVLHGAQHLYEGAKVFDGHRTDAAMASSGVGNIIGSIHTIEAVAGGLDGTLHLQRCSTPRWPPKLSIGRRSLASPMMSSWRLAGRPMGSKRRPRSVVYCPWTLWRILPPEGERNVRSREGYR